MNWGNDWLTLAYRLVFIPHCEKESIRKWVLILLKRNTDNIRVCTSDNIRFHNVKRRKHWVI